jgi:hypothetical protein
VAQKGPNLLALLQSFFSAAEGSIKGFLNPEEFFRSILTALGSGTSIGLVMAALHSILTNAVTIFPNPSVAALATGLLTLVIDILRRQSQGSPPSPTPPQVEVQVLGRRQF